MLGVIIIIIKEKLVMIRKIAILTSGGDAPAMNACLRACIRAGLYQG